MRENAIVDCLPKLNIELPEKCAQNPLASIGFTSDVIAQIPFIYRKMWLKYLGIF